MYLEYLWHSVLKRTDEFWETTPKKIFGLLEAHRKYNGIKNEDEQREYVETTQFG